MVSTMTSDPTLLILAAGMGSRYGGLKQLDPMGPNGETILDFSIHDAHQAGFGQVVFVIRKDFDQAFRDGIGSRCEGKIQTGYAYQQLDDLPDGLTVPEGREKPWGTSQAIWAARELLDNPFAVINADDFYGRPAYEAMARHLTSIPDKSQPAAAMVGYPLINTLSPNGTVNRGICELKGGRLEAVEEFTSIRREEDGKIHGDNLKGERSVLDEGAIASMNFWGFTPSVFPILGKEFSAWLKENREVQNSEYYIPTLVDSMMHEHGIACPVLKADSPWFGVTYPEDKPEVVKQISQLIEAGEYAG